MSIETENENLLIKDFYSAYQWISLILVEHISANQCLPAFIQFRC